MNTPEKMWARDADGTGTYVSCQRYDEGAVKWINYEAYKARVAKSERRAAEAADAKKAEIIARLSREAEMTADEDIAQVIRDCVWLIEVNFDGENPKVTITDPTTP